MRFVIATGNKSKLSEMRDILSALGIESVSQAEAGAKIEPEETGTTFYENALIKARAVCYLTGLPAIADDSGLCVSALGGAPGVYSKRFGGGGLSDTELCRYLIQKMDKTEQRTAKFVSCIVCAFPGGDVVSAEGECRGEIITELRGEGGFGYDPVFLVDSLDKTMAELSADEKNAVSHRGAALRAFSRELSKYFSGTGQR